MAQIDWENVIGWQEDQINELRFSGFSLLREGQYDKALLIFEALVLLKQKNAYDHQTLGTLYLQIGEREKALEWLNRALAIDPIHEPTLLNKAKALLLLKRKGEAFVLLSQLEKSPLSFIAGDATALRLCYS